MELKTLSRFEILRLLGKWELGRVYKGVDPQSSRWVAIRDIHSDASHPETELKVHRAVDAASRARILDSPNIVRLQEIGEAEGVFFLVTEYVEGTTLASLLAQKTEFSVLDLTDFTRQVCMAIDHAHSRSLVHSNLNPANLMQEWDGNVKVMDYGVAVNVLERIQGAAIPDSIHYLSPEQVQGQTFDFRSNLFSWGSILYEMFVGEKAFNGADPKMILEKIVTATPAFPQAKSSKHPALCKIILKALSKAPQERFHSGDEFIRAMEQCGKPAAAVVTPPQVVMGPAPAQQPVWRPVQPVNSLTTTVATPASPGVVQGRDTSGQNHGAGAAAAGDSASQFIVVPSRASAVVPDPQSPVPAQPPARRVRRPFVTIGLAAAVILLIFATLFSYALYMRARREPLQAGPVVPETVQPAVQSQAPEDPVAEVQSTEPERESEVAVKKPSVHAAVRTTPELTSELVVTSFPEGAAIQLNGASVNAVTPFTLTGLAAGDYAVSVTKPGYTSETRTVQMKAGEKASVLLHLTELLATVAISSDPAGAAVFVDGRDVGHLTPISVRMGKGTHTFTVAKQGFFEASNHLQLAPGQTYQFSPRLLPMGRAEDVKPAGKLKKMFGGSGSDLATVEIRTNPKGAQITVNRRAMEKTTPAEYLFPGGVYEITLTAPGYQSIRKTINAVQGARIVIDETMQKSGI